MKKHDRQFVMDLAKAMDEASCKAVNKYIENNRPITAIELAEASMSATCARIALNGDIDLVITALVTSLELAATKAGKEQDVLKMLVEWGEQDEEISDTVH